MTDQSTWLPIETAPRDGTLIMLDGGYWDDDFEKFDGVMIARWHRGWWLIAALEGGYSCAEYSGIMYQPPPSRPAWLPQNGAADMIIKCGLGAPPSGSGQLDLLSSYGASLSPPYLRRGSKNSLRSKDFLTNQQARFVL